MRDRKTDPPRQTTTPWNYGKLRICDLVAFRLDDVALNERVRSRATIMQRKTGRPVQFEITEQPQEAVERRLENKDLYKGEPLFPSWTTGRDP